MIYVSGEDVISVNPNIDTTSGYMSIYIVYIHLTTPALFLYASGNISLDIHLVASPDMMYIRCYQMYHTSEIYIWLFGVLLIGSLYTVC